MLQRLRTLKLNKTWIVLGVALGIGLLAALAARNYLSNQMEAIEARDRNNKVNLVVAKRELKRGDRLSTENVAVRAIPRDYAHSSAIAPGDFERLEGQVLAFPVKAGEMVLWSLIEGKKVPTFSARVEAGHRAVTVPVDEINSMSGLLEPGDIIDLVASFDRKGKKTTFPLLQGVQVMATGQRSVDDPKSGERRQYSTVTLEATPEQARQVIVAREVGRVTALLRNPQDKQTTAVSSKDLATLLSQQTDGKAWASADGDAQVPVLYGGRGGKFPPEALKLGQYVHAAASASGESQAEAAPAARTPGLVPASQPLATTPIAAGARQP